MFYEYNGSRFVENNKIGKIWNNLCGLNLTQKVYKIYGSINENKKLVFYLFFKETGFLM